VASSVTQFSNLIDISFPVPGQDNDTQGFRSNFSRIQSALSVAGNEISRLQLSSIDLNSTNDFGNNIVKRVALQNSAQVINNLGIVSNTVTLDYALGSYQQIIVEGGIYNVVVNNWPPLGQCGTLRLEIAPTSSDPVSINFVGNAFILTRAPLPITYTQTDPIVWELWSPDSGTTVYAHELGSANSIVESANIVAYNSLGIDQNRYNIRADTSATIVSTSGTNYAQEIALLPNIVPATIVEWGCEPNIVNSNTTTHFTVSGDDDVKYIRDGSFFWFNSSNVKYTVTGTVGNTVFVTPVIDRSLLSAQDNAGATVRFINPRYNQNSVLNFTKREPTEITGRTYDLEGQVYADGQKLWVAYRDYAQGTNQWLKAATQPGRNVFTQVNTFTNITDFKAPIALANYTEDQAEDLIPIARDGWMIFITSSINRPAYFFNGRWYAVGLGDGGGEPSTGEVTVEPTSGSWNITIGLETTGPDANYQLPLGLTVNNIGPNWDITV
jgi:hypothetical protein